MTATRFGRAGVIVAFACALVAFSLPAAAQSGALKGRVTDAANKPVEGATVVITHVDTGRRVQVATDKKGDYVQVGLQPGSYTVSATKGDLTQTYSVKVSLDQKVQDFHLKPGAPGEVSAADAKKQADRVANIQKTFAEAATLTNEGKFDEAIEKFNAVAVELPGCFDCYNNLGTIYGRKQEWDKAEEAFKKALDLNAGEKRVAAAAADSYNGLATVYNAQKKFKEAQEMSGEATKLLAAGGAAGGGNAVALYNAAVIAWNAQDYPKAHELLQQSVKVDPNYGDAHFLLGQALLNLGKLGEAATEFETYLKVAPNGPKAQQAKEFFEQLKQYRK